MAMKARPKTEMKPLTQAKPCQGIVYRGFNVKTRCKFIQGHRGFCG